MTTRDAAALLVRDHDGLLLMARTAYRPGLILPGGVVEADESPAAAAEREVHEETGLRLAAIRLLAVEHVPPAAGRGGLRFVFGAAPVAHDVALAPQPDEVQELLWLPPAGAVERHVATGRGRLAAALDADADGSTRWLDGRRRLPPR